MERIYRKEMKKIDKFTFFLGPEWKLENLAGTVMGTVACKGKRFRVGGANWISRKRMTRRNEKSDENGPGGKELQLPT
jgi:hypothetical protein